MDSGPERLDDACRSSPAFLDDICVLSGKLFMRPSWVPRDVAYLSRCGFEPLVAVTVATSVAKVAAEVASGWARVAAWQPINALDELVIRCQRRARYVLAVAAAKRLFAACDIQWVLRGYLARQELKTSCGGQGGAVCVATLVSEPGGDAAADGCAGCPARGSA